MIFKNTKQKRFMFYDFSSNIFGNIFQTIELPYETIPWKINCAYFCTGDIFGKSKPQQLLVLVLHIKNQYAKLRGSECNLDDFLLTWITESNRGDQFFCWTVFGLNKVFCEIKQNESFIQLHWLKNRNQATN